MGVVPMVVGALINGDLQERNVPSGNMGKLCCFEVVFTFMNRRRMENESTFSVTSRHMNMGRG
jgi:hypothetical protein